MFIEPFSLKEVVQSALKEDLGSGDLTSASIFPSTHLSRAFFLVKKESILCGLPVVKEIFHQLSPEINFLPQKQDGDRIMPGTVVAEVVGPTYLLLSGERVALNFLQRLSGIATLTAKYLAQVEGLDVKIVDTRKTTPGLRVLEKYAVRTGGGTNHRLGLFDAVMIKDNHIKAAGGIKEAVRLVRQNIPFLTPIEVEAVSVEDALEALEAGAHVIMLDNMPTDEMARAVQAIGKRAVVEASGGITLERLREVAATRVDVISAGALTHSAPSIDISMKIQDVL
ncbi:carboxylating nicotinate-nucleotide diphosphorylase [Candidatus Formimonas warabiya]|uniref:Probable nicotinate-nucleotide pyrophosphorylase [carboxylating] n=1 Tax=Formimonas warabiya TaxID=1761012 RepID=A0A3G1KX52_FORW1|nr:carboxylating nicotinate-nucleotide diphosphorylase [Candidatus Formimonas warabiya]ATW27022.1 nicotinate-nucleotide diphosphorylase (carboxylating) [Candidatus Formimonas warabiya]